MLNFGSVNGCYFYEIVSWRSDLDSVYLNKIIDLFQFNRVETLELLMHAFFSRIYWQLIHTYIYTHGKVKTFIGNWG